MYLAVSVGGGAMSATVKVAQDYVIGSGGKVFAASATDVHVEISCGTAGICLRMTRDQLDQLVIQLSQEQRALTDTEPAPPAVPSAPPSARAAALQDLADYDDPAVIDAANVRVRIAE